MEAANHVEKVRVNPGNFADSKLFAIREYTDDQYVAELGRIEERFAPLVEKCKARGIAMRIGTNHGSLSDRIMNRFGDTPLGMVESALEFAHICGKYGYHDIIFSMKASNPKVMIQAYRLLAGRLDEEGLDYPFHLGVTEAGNGEDGRIKSAIGIGSLLDDGIGDTIRVSLTEDPEFEVPVAFALARPYQAAPAPSSHKVDLGSGDNALSDLRDPYAYARRESHVVPVGTIAVGAGQPVRVIHPFLGALAKVDNLLARAKTLAEADGLIASRPDALSVHVSTEADVAAVEALKTAFDTATDSLPLIVCAARVRVAGSHPPRCRCDLYLNRRACRRLRVRSTHHCCVPTPTLHRSRGRRHKRGHCSRCQRGGDACPRSGTGRRHSRLP